MKTFASLYLHQLTPRGIHWAHCYPVRAKQWTPSGSDSVESGISNTRRTIIKWHCSRLEQKRALRRGKVGLLVKDVYLWAIGLYQVARSNIDRKQKVVSVYKLLAAGQFCLFPFLPPFLPFFLSSFLPCFFPLLFPSHSSQYQHSRPIYTVVATFPCSHSSEYLTLD